MSIAAYEHEVVVDDLVEQTPDDPVELQPVPVNVYRTSDAIVVVAPMPGVMPEDVDVQLIGSRLYLRAQLRSRSRRTHLVHEWRYGRYGRTVVLPPQYQGRVRASLGQGQLAVSVARVEADDRPAEPRQVTHRVTPHSPGDG